MEKAAFRPTDILIPSNTDFETWSVIACDQFTSDRAYWDAIGERVRDRLSTFNMILPEAYLLDGISADEMAPKANAAMAEALAAGVFEELHDSFVYVEREVTGGVRRGLVGALDLEAYDYSPLSHFPVRASERTVEERLPPRVRIREGAPLELPHIMALIDDPERSVIEPLHRRTHELHKLYDFELMRGGGRLRGWQVSGEDAKAVCAAFEKLTEREVQIVVGDGNHSLAAAKELWNKIRSELTPSEAATHPARYALVELNNVYDNGIVFEPIHRIVFGVDPAKLLEAAQEHITGPDGREIEYVMGGRRAGKLRVRGKSFGGMIELIDSFVEECAAMSDGYVDYIHDEPRLIELTGGDEESIGFILPSMDKSELFKTVISDGVFPKKSFSIGHAKDKRYYLEARRIR